MGNEKRTVRKKELGKEKREKVGWGMNEDCRMLGILAGLYRGDSGTLLNRILQNMVHIHLMEHVSLWIRTRTTMWLNAIYNRQISVQKLD
jgi:hypothetical protein